MCYSGTRSICRILLCWCTLTRCIVKLLLRFRNTTRINWKWKAANNISRMSIAILKDWTWATAHFLDWSWFEQRGECTNFSKLNNFPYIKQNQLQRNFHLLQMFFQTKSDERRVTWCVSALTDFLNETMTCHLFPLVELKLARCTFTEML